MKHQCSWGVSLWLALCGSACGDASEGAVDTNATQPSPSAAPSTGNAAPPVAMTPVATTPAATTPAAMPGAQPPGGTPTPPAQGSETPSTPTVPPSGMPAAGGMMAMMPPPAPAPASNFPGESCDGCARFFLPMTAPNQRGDFELDLAAPIDLTGASLRFRLMTAGFTGNAGGVSLYVRDTGNFDKGFVWSNLSALGTWTDVAVDFTNASLAGNVSFDITKVAKIGVQLNSSSTFAGANFKSATLYLDSVSFSNAPTADLTFSDGIGDFGLVSSDAPAGTSVNFLAP